MEKCCDIVKIHKKPDFAGASVIHHETEPYKWKGLKVIFETNWVTVIESNKTTTYPINEIERVEMF